MPVNDRYPLADVLAACERWHARQAADGVHRVRDARAASTTATRRRSQLAKLLDPRIYKVNLIPYNPTGMYDGSVARGDRRVQGRARGARAARDRAAHARPRHRRACGQLAAKAAVAPSRRRARGSSPLHRRAGARLAGLEAAGRAGRPPPRASGPTPTASGRSSSELRPKSLRNSGVVRYSMAPNCERPLSSISPRSSSVPAAESALTPRMRVISGRETGCR